MTAMAETPILEARALDVGYGPRPVVQDIDLAVHRGEIVALLGPNGAGKTTLLHGLSGALTPSGGQVRWRGRPTTSPAHRRARDGLGFVTEDRAIFAKLTTRENLRLGRGGVERALALFPELSPLLNRTAGLLSGGEQQMLALGRTLAADPAVLLVDELSLGLAPLVVRRLVDALVEAAGRGLGVLLVEQNLSTALEVADRAHVLRRGRTVLTDSTTALRGRAGAIHDAYLSTQIIEDGAPT